MKGQQPPQQPPHAGRGEAGRSWRHGKAGCMAATDQRHTSGPPPLITLVKPLASRKSFAFCQSTAKAGTMGSTRDTVRETDSAAPFPAATACFVRCHVIWKRPDLAPAAAAAVCDDRSCLALGEQRLQRCQVQRFRNTVVRKVHTPRPRRPSERCKCRGFLIAGFNSKVRIPGVNHDNVLLGGYERGQLVVGRDTWLA